MCGSVRIGGKNLKSVWWNDEIKAAVRRCWKLAMRRLKKDVWKYIEKRKVRRCIYQSKKK